MASDNDDDDVLNTAALYLGGGALGWMAGGLVARYLEKQRPVGAPRTVEPATALVHPLLPVLGPVDQPVTSPSQVDDPPPTSLLPQTGAPSDPYSDVGAKGPNLSRRFDAIFETYRGGIPIEYLRALATRESGMQPDASSGPARGLLQITEVARIEYNRVNQTSYTREQLLDPKVNVAIACWLLRHITESYQRHHGDVANLRMDWNNPHFVGLLTQGWNAGYSEVAGVGWVARYLKARNVTVTIDAVHQHAAAAGAIRHLRDPGRLKWWRSVVDLYERERRRGASWWAVKTPGVILEELNLAKQEIYALGRDIYAAFMHPFERQFAKAFQRFETTYGRKPGIGRLAEDSDMATVHSWMEPVPTADDSKHASYRGRFVFEWGEFERGFGDFFAAHSGSWTERFWTGVYDQTVEYRQRAADWRRRFEQMGRSATSRRGASWWAIKTPGVILEELNLAKQEIYALGRDIYATFRHPFERQLAEATQRFEATYGRKPGVGRLAEDSDMATVHSSMEPVPTADDLKHVSYQGRFVFEWGEFERGFGDFFAAHSGSWTERFWTGVYDQTVEYRERGADWRRRFEAMGGKPTTPTPRPPADSFLSGFAIPWRTILLVGGGITAGLLIVPAAIRAARDD